MWEPPALGLPPFMEGGRSDMLWATRMPSQPFYHMQQRKIEIAGDRIRYGLLGSGCLDTKLGEFVRVVTCPLKEAACNT